MRSLVFAQQILDTPVGNVLPSVEALRVTGQQYLDTPVCSTYKMPCRHCRSGTGRGPGAFIGPRRKQRLEKLPQLIIQQSA